MATRANARKYKRNPEYPAERFKLNGVLFTDETVVEGDHWEKYTTQLFPNIPPQLVYAPTGDQVTTGGTARAERPKRDVEPPKGTTTAAFKRSEEPAAGDGKKKLVETGSKPEPPAPKPKAIVPPAPEPEPEPEEEPEEELEDDVEPEDLTVINGVGGSRAESLAEAGFPTVQSVANADPAVLLQRVRDTGARMNLATARTIVRQAKNAPKE